MAVPMCSYSSAKLIQPAVVRDLNVPAQELIDIGQGIVES